jgi:hypothetical protein
MGHSEASLYKAASIGRPLTVGSFGSCSSCGVISDGAELVRGVVSAARVFARPRKKGDPVGGEPNGEEGAGKENPVFDGEKEEPSDCMDGDLVLIGTAR